MFRYPIVLFLGVLITLFFQKNSFAQTYTLVSPDFKTKLSVVNLGDLSFKLTRANQEIAQAKIAIELLDGNVWGKDAKIKTAISSNKNELIKPTVAIKNREIKNEYNELSILYRDNYSIIFRLYNDAFAYRWVSNGKDTLVIKNEISEWQLNPKSTAFLQQIDQKEIGLNNYERLYQPSIIENLPSNTKTQLPLYVGNDQLKLIFSESDLLDYPGLYFEVNNSGKMKAVFPAVVKKTETPTRPNFGWDRTNKPIEWQQYIAKTKPSRDFPWRVVGFGNEDNQLITNEIVYKLASDNVLKDTLWIKPGKVAWDWWNNWNLTGVNFEAGINNQTYQHYIDFASENKIEYIVLDDGWYEPTDLTICAKNINVEELIKYGKTKNVKIILWASWKILNDNMNKTMETWQKWGVAGIKVDFTDRDDQEMVNFYETCAAIAAAHQLIVDFHGAYKPTGLHKKYPNILNYEGVMGLENNKWAGQFANPEMAVTIPFTRMFAGPLDYTPGAMQNSQASEYAVINQNPMSLGTRCQQLAMYVVFESPLGMLADSPSKYKKEPEAMDFLSSVPTTWDQTIPLLGSIGDYIAIARKKDNVWYIAAMTDWSARDLTINLDFLGKGEHQMSVWEDGKNAERNGSDFRHQQSTVSQDSKINIHLAKGGGWIAKIKPTN